MNGLIDYWLKLRRLIIEISKRSYQIIINTLCEKQSKRVTQEIIMLISEYQKYFIRVFNFPFEDRPFDCKADIPDNLNNIKIKYFQSYLNFCNQFSAFVLKSQDNYELALFNLRESLQNVTLMNSFFSEICSNNNMRIIENKDIFENENKILSKLEIACSYYINNERSGYFNKFDIDRWALEDKNSKILSTNNELTKTLKGFNIEFPKVIFDEGNIKSYPIIINLEDLNNPERFNEIIYIISKCNEFNFNVLKVIIYEFESILPIGFGFSKELLNNFSNTDPSYEELITDFDFPFPFEVGPKLLDCFEKSYIIKSSSNSESMALLGEILWCISIYKSKLTNSNDGDYLSKVLDDYCRDFDRIYNNISKKYPKKTLLKIKDKYNSVLNGEIFDDNDLIYFIELKN